MNSLVETFSKPWTPPHAGPAGPGPSGRDPDGHEPGNQPHGLELVNRNPRNAWEIYEVLHELDLDDRVLTERIPVRDLLVDARTIEDIRRYGLLGYKVIIACPFYYKDYKLGKNAIWLQEAFPHGRIKLYLAFDSISHRDHVIEELKGMSLLRKENPHLPRLYFAIAAEWQRHPDVPNAYRCEIKGSGQICKIPLQKQHKIND